MKCMNFVKILVLKAGQKWGVPILHGFPYVPWLHKDVSRHSCHGQCLLLVRVETTGQHQHEHTYSVFCIEKYS